jgi:dTDP-4-amino-4,6-dideoxygalactose transaminase
MSNFFSLIKRRLAIWPTLPLHVYFRSDLKKAPFPLDQDNCRVYSKARHAIWNALKMFNLDDDSEILVPAYHHGSEIEAILRAGLNVKYYEINNELEPDPIVLESLLTEKVKALYIIHYLGFPQDAIFWRKWCDDRNILLIEDAAQAFLATQNSRPVGSIGHMGIFCLYKTYGIPDGGAVVSIHPPKGPTAKARSGTWGIFKRHINWLAAKRKEIGFLHLMIKPVLAWFKRVREDKNAEFELGDPNTPPLKFSIQLLPKLVNDNTAECRRQNYRFLLTHLRDIVPHSFSVLPAGASPFAFPIEVDDANEFLKRLRTKGIIGLLFWLNPHPTLPVEKFPKSKSLRNKVIALPVHQELTNADLINIVDAVKACYIKPVKATELLESSMNQI